jgi:hypothetical protein
MKRVTPFVLSALISACTVGLHGSFVDRSYIPDDREGPGVLLGKVHGKSCQKNVLYIFPRGEEVATDEAISDALRQREGTDYLVDISIDNTRHFGFGYSVSCMEVDAEAYSLGGR